MDHEKMLADVGDFIQQYKDGLVTVEEASVNVIDTVMRAVGVKSLEDAPPVPDTAVR